MGFTIELRQKKNGRSMNEAREEPGPVGGLLPHETGQVQQGQNRSGVRLMCNHPLLVEAIRTVVGPETALRRNGRAKVLLMAGQHNEAGDTIRRARMKMTIEPAKSLLISSKKDRRRWLDRQGVWTRGRPVKPRTAGTGSEKPAVTHRTRDRGAVNGSPSPVPRTARRKIERKQISWPIKGGHMEKRSANPTQLVR